MSSTHLHTVSALRLGWIFLRIGATAFGGLGAALALVERELVTKRRMPTEAHVTEAPTYTKLLPGSTVIQVMSYLGYILGGWPGSALATAAFVLPSAVLMLVLAAAAAQQLQRFMQHPWLQGFGRGTAPAVVGLLGVTALNRARQSLTHWAYALVAVLALGLALRTKVHPMLLLLGGTALGWVIGALTEPALP